MIVEQLKHEMNKSDEMKSCIDIMNDILIILTRNDVVSSGKFCTCTQFSWIFCRLLKLLSSQIRVKSREVESGDGAEVRALASHRSSPGSIPRRGVTCGLLVLLDLVPRLFFREIPNSVPRCCSFCLISRGPKHFSCYSELGLYKYRISSALNSVSPRCTLSYHLTEAWWAYDHNIPFICAGLYPWRCSFVGNVIIAWCGESCDHDGSVADCCGRYFCFVAGRNPGIQ